MDPNHRLHHPARCDDVAFGFRDVAAEGDALAAMALRHGTGRVGSVLELAAGPARHARKFARRGEASSALDASASMCDYATARAPLVPFDNAHAAWRRVPVLRRRETA